MQHNFIAAMTALFSSAFSPCRIARAGEFQMAVDNVLSVVQCATFRGFLALACEVLIEGIYEARTDRVIIQLDPHFIGETCTNENRDTSTQPIAVGRVFLDTRFSEHVFLE